MKSIWKPEERGDRVGWVGTVMPSHRDMSEGAVDLHLTLQRCRQHVMMQAVDSGSELREVQWGTSRHSLFSLVRRMVYARAVEG